MSPMRERPEISCRVLLDVLSKSRDTDERNLLLDDLLWKVRDLPSEFRCFVEREALKKFAQTDIVDRFEERKIEMTRKPVDVAIMTVIPEELDAAKIAFDIDLNAKEDNIINGLCYWNAAVEMKDSRIDLSVVVTMVGESGNVCCAAACDRLFNSYSVGLCILIGIAAGLKEKVTLGDVVVADIILDYEKARLEPDGSKKRPVQYSPRIPIARNMEYFRPTKFGWKDFYKKSFVAMQAMPDIDLPQLENDFIPSYYNGVILSGEKLIADGLMDERRREYHDRILAAEMEGVGFARLCEEHDIPWLVMRGISDYGNPDKDNSWQMTSALSAATAARVFLENSYRKPQNSPCQDG